MKKIFNTLKIFQGIPLFLAIILVILAPIFLKYSLCYSAVDPNIQWKKYTLPKFELIFDARHQDVANLYAKYLEEIESILPQYFQQIPSRTVIVLSDNTDLTNGGATPLPYPMIQVFPVLPPPLETIGEYGIWERELLIHEYTHILSFEQRRGAVQFLKYIFGQIMTPNILLPRWNMEGIAVDLETRLSEKGRLRSSHQDASLRAYVLSQTWDLVPLYEMNEWSIPTWPYGSRPYLMGSLMWSEMISKFGEKSIGELYLAYGGRFPYFINGPLESKYDTDYEKIFDAMKIQVETRVNLQLNTLKQKTSPTADVLDLKELEFFSAQISPDGMKMAYIAKDDSTKRSIQLLERTNAEETFSNRHKKNSIQQNLFEEMSGMQSPLPRRSNIWDEPPSGSIQRISWFPDSTQFVYDLVNDINIFHEVSDLHVYNIKEAKSKPITKNQRAREPVVSPDGKRIAYVGLRPSATDLWEIDLATKKSRPLYLSQLQERISYPTYLSNTEILFSLRRNGQEEVFLLHTDSLVAKKINTQNFPEIHYLDHVGDSIYFSSTKNGVSNIYRASLNINTNTSNTDIALASVEPLTHSLTGAYTFTVDPLHKDLIYTELQNTGFVLRRISKANSLGDLPSVAPLFLDRYPLRKSQDSPVTSLVYEPKDYSPWPYLLPTYWIPLNIAATNDGMSIGLSTSGADPLYKHLYSLWWDYTAKTKTHNYDFMYFNQSTPTTFIAQFSEIDSYFLIYENPVRKKTGSLSALWQIASLSPDLFVSLGGLLDHKKNDTLDYNQRLGLFLETKYSNYSQSGAQISPEKGYGIRFLAIPYFKTQEKVEREYDFQKYYLSAVKYVSKFLPSHHVLMIKGQAAYISGTSSILDYNSTYSLNPLPNTLVPNFFMRGYPVGQFIAKSLLNMNIEYRFPITDLRRGWGTAPLYLKRMHGALILDGIQADGYSYDWEKLMYTKLNREKSYWNYGAEIKWDVTLGYSFPITIGFGLYYPTDKGTGKGESQFALNISL